MNPETSCGSGDAIMNDEQAVTLAEAGVFTGLP